MRKIKLNSSKLSLNSQAITNLTDYTGNAIFGSRVLCNTGGSGCQKSHSCNGTVCLDLTLSKCGGDERTARTGCCVSL